MINFKRFLGIALTSSFLVLASPRAIKGAETITFSIMPLGQFDISVQSLTTFAETGTIDPDFKFYTQHLKPEELEKFRGLLNHSFKLNSIEAFRFFNTTFGKEIAQQLSYIIAAPTNESQPFLEGAIITAAQNPDGFKIIDVINAYGGSDLVLNLDTFKNTIDQADSLYQATDRIFTWLGKQDSPSPPVPPNLKPLALAEPGPQQWKTTNLTIPRPDGQPVKVFVYLPQGNTKPVPLVVIAPGLNSNFQAFTYIADHLASYGFAIAGIDFPESDAARMQDSLQGLDAFPNPNAWLEQPKDVTLVLDTLTQKAATDPAWQGKFDINNVGILGHSLGGYTAIASGGASLEWPALLQECEKLNQPNQINLNPALLWQCQGVDSAPPLSDLQDKRIKAVLAINPVTNPIFGPDGMKNLAVPTLIVAGSDDIFAPPVPEQIIPFSLIEDTDKYLLLVQNATHLSFIAGTENLPEKIVGPGQDLAYTYLKSLGLAFFDLYLQQNSDSALYLTDEAVQRMSQAPLPLQLVQSLTPAQLEQAMDINN
ncbi:alpha/beta hydrolase [Synechocystis salina]|uniref:Alpha/beta hydrolase n=2 Tax=Synechocystis TaxID=1142 RepID=A0ABR9VQI0_9SYNC|nr:alpha/beta hydrolase [Synechocystis salina]MBE9240379.1 alpha/beta hydrolase [Synechocystis salina LEGE 00041]MBE9253612.1 alpha/beta hydrolase [Synechocystis salina LEGE 00031]